MSTGEGRFTHHRMTRAMQAIAGRLDVATTGWQLLRLTNNAVFALPEAGLVIRITRSHGLHERVRKVVRLGSWFEGAGAPTIRLAPGVVQPIAVDGLLASVWTYLPPRDPEPTTEDLGRVLRRFHGLPMAPGVPSLPELPRWDPVGDARTRLDDAEALDDNDRAGLVQWCDDLQPRLDALLERTEPALIHGDAHVGNLLRAPADEGADVVLCDFDATCRGPRQVDLVAVAVGEIRFARPGAHRTLAAAYGVDVTADPDWALLREARELKMVAAAVPLLASSAGVAEEFRTRLASARDRDDEVRWTPFADVSRRQG